MKELYSALSKCQSVLGGAKKESTNPFFKSKYADLESVWDAIRGPLTDNGLCIVQLIDNKNSEIVLTTILGHCSGEQVTSEYPVRPKDDSPQAIGSAITYARRYALAAIVGVYQTDDDGNYASEPRPVHNKQPNKENENGTTPQPPKAREEDKNPGEKVHEHRQEKPSPASAGPAKPSPGPNPAGAKHKDTSTITPTDQAQLYLATQKKYGPRELQDRILKKYNCPVNELKKWQMIEILEAVK